MFKPCVGQGRSVVDDTLLDPRVKWVAIVFQEATNDQDRFEITAWVVDPGSAVGPS